MADELMAEAALNQADVTEGRLAAAVRVAAEAMRLLTREQLAELRHRLDELDATAPEVGNGGVST